MSNIEVEVPFTCMRSGRTTKIAMPLADAGQYASNQEVKQKECERLRKELEEEPLPPDLLIMFRGRVVMLQNVAASEDLTIGRALNAALNQEGAFEVAPPRPRKAKAAPAEPAAEHAVDVTVEVD